MRPVHWTHCAASPRHTCGEGWPNARWLECSWRVAGRQERRARAASLKRSHCANRDWRARRHDRQAVMCAIAPSVLDDSGRRHSSAKSSTTGSSTPPPPLSWPITLVGHVFVSRASLYHFARGYLACLLAGDRSYENLAVECPTGCELVRVGPFPARQVTHTSTVLIAIGVQVISTNWQWPLTAPCGLVHARQGATGRLYIFTERDGRKGPPAGKKARCNRTNTPHSKSGFICHTFAMATDHGVPRGFRVRRAGGGSCSPTPCGSSAPPGARAPDNGAAVSHSAIRRANLSLHVKSRALC
jgi:hypothetical protein